GFSLRKPPRILPLSPTNNIPSGGNTLPSASSSSGFAGFIPPSYQNRSNAGSVAWLGNLKRTMHDAWNATSFTTFLLTWSITVLEVEAYASALSGAVLTPSVRNIGHKL